MTDPASHCQDCGKAVDMTFHGLCRICADDIHDYDDAVDGSCWNCGGEGFTYGCDWEWQCDTWDGDSCLCTRRCEWCNPPKLTPEQEAEREALRKVMTEALAEGPKGAIDL